MAEFILKNSKGVEQIFNHNKIFVEGTDGELVQFTQGKGESALEPLEVTQNGTYTPNNGVDGFSSVDVNVPDVPAVVQPLEVTENGTYNAPDGVDGFNSVVVAVEASSADVRYVTFMSYDGLTEYGKKAVAVGDDCADPIARGIFDTPTMESDVQYNYTFNGWATEVNGAVNSNWNKAVTEDKVVYANFKGAVRYYTITYYDSDGTTVLKTESLAYGAMPSYTPTKENQIFSGWSPEVHAVNGDANYTAAFEEKVTFATASWEKIISIAESGKAAETFSVGDIKQITITYDDGTTEENALIIADFNKLKLSDGTKDSMVLVSAYALEDKKPLYNSQVSGQAVYNGSHLASWLNSTLVNALPTELQIGLKEGIAYSTYFPKYQKCALLSLEELQLTKTNFSEYGSVPLSLFSSNAKRIRTQGKNGSAVVYLTRASYYQSSTVQCALVNTDGAVYGGTSSSGYGRNTVDYGIVFRLCI